MNGEFDFERDAREDLFDPPEMDVGAISAADFELMEILAAGGSAASTDADRLNKLHPEDRARAKTLIDAGYGLYDNYSTESERDVFRAVMVSDICYAMQRDRELAESINNLSRLEVLDMRQSLHSLTPGVNRHHPSLRYIALSNISPFWNTADLEDFPIGLHEVVLDKPTKHYSHFNRVSLQTIDEAMVLARNWREAGLQCRVRAHVYRKGSSSEESYDGQPPQTLICGEGTWWPREEDDELPEHRVFSSTV